MSSPTNRVLTNNHENFQAVIFDLDGTLLDTLDDLADSANEMLASRGLPGHPTEAYKQFIGNGMLKLVERILPADLGSDAAACEAALAEYQSIYRNRCNFKTRPYPGIEDLLARLVEAGVPVGVLSNKQDDLTRRCIDAAFPAVPWVAVFGQRDGVPRKPDPSAAREIAALAGRQVRRCVFVGDSGVDIRTAINARMLPVGVTWGFREVVELQAAGASIVIDHPLELLSLVEMAVAVPA